MITATHLDRPGDNYPVHKPLSEIIDQIRGDSLKQLVEQIQQAGTSAAELKAKLPVMVPTLCFYGENRFTDKARITGIVQFDVDTKDNPGIDIDHVQRLVIAKPETVYCFKSPRQGLKFGILTDFTNNEGDSVHTTKQRYKAAYALVCDWLKLPVVFDDRMQHMKYNCFLSHDPQAYYNGKAQPLVINSQCSYTQPEIIATDNTVSPEFIHQLLEFIPDSLNWGERLPVNLAVLQHLGCEGIQTLKTHWQVEDAEKLDRDLHSQHRSIIAGNVRGHIGTLVNIAKEHGYTATTGRARQKLKPKPCSHQFEPMVSHSEGMKRLKALVSEFFDTGESRFINVSTGAGKTTEVLNAIRNLPAPELKPRQQALGKNRKPRVLILVQDHELAEQYKREYGSGMHHIKGRDHVCENPQNLKFFNREKVPVPLSVCSRSMCHMHDTCAYIRQFKQFHSSIRIMTHDELFNEPSRFIRDQKKAGSTHRHGIWKPDYIIVDENCLKLCEDVESLESNYDSVRNVLNDVLNGVGIETATLQHRALVIRDHSAMSTANKNRAGVQAIKSRYDYVKAITDMEDSCQNSEVLEQLFQFVMTGNDDHLKHLYIQNKKLCFSKVKTVHSRYQKTPKLFLDATARESVITKTLSVPFHKIQIEQKPDIGVYQCETTVTKNKLGDEQFRAAFVQSLKAMCAKYKNVGIISYKSVEGVGQFPQWLAGEIGACTYSHFGALRGMNNFNECDCILVVGRQLIQEADIKALSVAVFGESSNDKEYFDFPVRVSGGQAMSVNNRAFTSVSMREVKHHFSDSETIQAIGRGRLIHGKAKDVYLFSHESLGGDVAVNGFFELETETQKFSEQKTALQEQGFCKNVPTELKKLGFSINSIKRDRVSIINQLLSMYGLFNVEFVDKHRNKKRVEYFVCDEEKLHAELAMSGAKSIDIKPA